MTTWRLLYENRFPKDPENGATIMDFPRAAQGAHALQQGPVFTFFTNVDGLPIADGRNLTYRPDALLRDVIGIDVAMEIALIGLFEARPITLFSTNAAGLAATLTAMSPPAATGLTTCRLTVRLDNSVTTVDGLRLRQRVSLQATEPRQLQVRWTTTGQLHVLLDGLLVAYENAVKPGYRFNLSQLAIGNVDQPSNGVVNASVPSFRLVELREESAADSLSEQLDLDTKCEVSERCQKVAKAVLADLLRESRTLMAAFNASKTSPWRQPDGDTPFKVPALAAHKAGSQAGVAFARYMHDGAAESRQEVFESLKKLLGILAADQPVLFKALLEKVNGARYDLDADCKGAEQHIRAANPRLFENLDPLSADFDELFRNLGAR